MSNRVAVAAALLVVVLAGCSSGSGPSGEASRAQPLSSPATTHAGSSTSTATGVVATPRPGGPAPTGVPAGMGSAAADGVFPRTVGHFGGSTRIPAEPKRIVTIATGQLDAALTLSVVPVAAATGAGA